MGIQDTYDPTLNETAGFLPSLEDDFADTKNFPPPHVVKPIGDNGKRLLHLIYWLTYTKPGREFLRANYPSKQNPPEQGRKSEADVEEILRAKFKADFKLDIDETVMNACIQLHFQATYWVDENKKFANPAANAAAKAAAKAQRDIHEANYNTYLSVITWQLWKDGTGHEFSLGW
jgi:hypothetical protein